MALKVRLNRPVIYRGRQYVAGEPIMADESYVKAWEQNGLIYDESVEDGSGTDDKKELAAEPATASDSPAVPSNGAAFGRASKGKKK